jgi:hypothetical protein
MKPVRPLSAVTLSIASVGKSPPQYSSTGMSSTYMLRTPRPRICVPHQSVETELVGV